MNEWKRILSDRKRLTIFLCLPLLCLVLFFYQKCDGDFSTLLTDAKEYRELLKEHSQSAPAQIVDAFSENWSLTDEEQRLLTQAEHLQSYGEYLERVQEQAHKMQASSIFNANKNSFTYRNIIKTAKDFTSCTAEGIRLGNDRAIQDWLSFSLADWFYLAMILLLVMSFLEERKKGLAAIVRTCSAGRGKLQVARLLVLLSFCAGMTLLLYYLPLGLSLCVDGGWQDWSRPIQSLPEFQKYTVPMRIAEFLIQFFFVKTICGVLLGVLIWFALSFLTRPQMGWLATAFGLVLEYLLYTLIPAQSIFSPFREINVFSYVFTSELFVQYTNINFFGFPIGRRTLLLGLLVCVTAVLSAVTILILTRRYPLGNRDIMGKWIDRWNQIGDGLRKHFGLYGFETYKFLFLSAGGLFLILGFLMTQNLNCGTLAYTIGEDNIYRQYVAEIQGPVTQDTYDYLVAARVTLENTPIDTAEYEVALDQLEETIASLEDGAWLVYEPMFMNCYGLDSSITQRQNALLSYIFLVVCLSVLFACEKNGDLRKILRTTPNGRSKVFWTKYAVALTLVLIVWLRIMCEEWQLSVNYMGEIIASAPCNSISLTQGFFGTVNTALAMLYLFKLMALLIPAHFCIFIGERCQSFEKAFLFSGVFILLPVAAYYFGADALSFVTPASFLADSSPIFYGTNTIPAFVVWMIASVLALFVAKRSWCRTLK